MKHLLTLLLACCMSGCMLDHRAASSGNSWFNPPPQRKRDIYDNGKELSRDRLRPVSESKESEAESLLAVQAFVELTEQDAASFTDNGLRPAPGTKPFLARGVYLNWGTGGFGAYVLPENDIFVDHVCLGRFAVPMKRRAVVLRLEHAPRNVYVGCSMAE
jgi:hypothetical protein